MPAIRQIQLGKNGVTEQFISNLKHHFNNTKNVKVSVLKSCCRDREELREINEKILRELGNNYTSRIIGYTIVIKKWRRDRRENLKENPEEEKEV
ncbi:MAG: CRS1 / YhbY (CRM) domain protein [Candidatus Diapherotrites archaeon ADurb.Bin253]|jgi:RNA-binding protein YhbY|nr:YhbY family RNA-binding protein [Candidatus Pacearchaeota archaeon]OQA68910.1 MAG: CRS1 / YhbY (CRM) domain protein [Candidatus Diapherotrites archaeon ADurb.Bin253]HNZ51769.1 YhbY family RNA-binding protein [Candidatus Pacearchaeota archaeon]HOC97156.1 YhbY family RNA-binding protein [Candidatus Pacearchaeota archaeon]HOH03889.1 YhbY family RNA-binding protein [Candidatus Pacearchaeota archaeon]